MLLKSERYEELNLEVLDLLETYDFPFYPLDVFALARKMGVALKPYSLISPANYRAFAAPSDDAFTFTYENYSVDKTSIYYNPNASKGRLAHSIAHEIAHIWLEHPNDNEPYETEANYFAAYLLAPIPIIIEMGFKDACEVKEYFGISYEAARIALERTRNRLRCKKPKHTYECQIVNLALKKGGGYLGGVL